MAGHKVFRGLQSVGEGASAFRGNNPIFALPAGRLAVKALLAPNPRLHRILLRQGFGGQARETPPRAPLSQPLGRTP